MFTRRTLIGLAAAAVLLGTTSLTMAADKPYIALISKGFQHQFWQAVKQGAEQAGKDFDVNVTFEGPDGEGAVDRQLDMISTALSKHPSALGIAAIDSQATVPLLQQFKDAGIPVIAFDSGVASDIPITSASTDNLASAALAADKMAELIGGEGEIAIVSFDQTSQTGIERRDGFVAQIKAKYPKITIVDSNDVTFTGRITAWGNFNLNEKNTNNTFTLTVSLSGSDGSTITVHEVQHFALNANGVVTVEFDKMNLTCG